MAFTFTVETDPYETVGRLKVMIGTYTNTAGSTGGDIDLTDHLTRVLHLKMQPTGSAVSATANAVNETMPLDLTAVTVVTIADEDGTWEAWGYG